MRGLSVDHAALGLVKVEPFTNVSLEFALFPVIPDSDFLLCFPDFSFLIVVTDSQLAFTFNAWWDVSLLGPATSREQMTHPTGLKPPLRFPSLLNYFVVQVCILLLFSFSNLAFPSTDFTELVSILR